MKKQEKFEPQDSNQRPRRDGQAVIDPADKGHQGEAPKTKKPALKRKFSEQPPTKHNAKT